MKYAILESAFVPHFLGGPERTEQPGQLPLSLLQQALHKNDNRRASLDLLYSSLDSFQPGSTWLLD